MASNGMDPLLARFAIAAAAELAGMHPQTLRQYDRLGLVVPDRTQGGSRRYTLRHVQRLQEIAQLSAEGVSLSAIARILELEQRVEQLESELVQLQDSHRRQAINAARVFAAASSGSVVAVKPGSRVPRQAELVLWRPKVNERTAGL